MLSTLTIDLGAIRRNAERLRDLVAPSAFAAVVKSNAYGHGLVETALALAGVTDLLAVYALEEALALRSGGITAPILILGPVAPRDLPRAHAAPAAITIWDSGAYFNEVVRVARERGAPFSIHVKINTGVARLGLEPHQAADAIALYLRTPQVRLCGVFTHLAAAEELEAMFTDRQIYTMHQALEPVEEELERGGVIRHAAASAAAIMWSQTRLQMVRVGLALYGLWPSPETRKVAERRLRLEPALRWTSHLVAVREVAAGVSIGYGRSYTTPAPTRIGVVPIGYADGVPRAASNRGAVLAGGRRCTIVGRVCMNMFMVDLGPGTGAAAPSSITLIGQDGEDRISAEDWATWSDTINYELVARLPEHLHREFIPAG